MYDAREVANFLLDYAEQRGVTLTNMALLKHIYFAHGWHLAGQNEPLIKNRIEAWEHGPVIRAVYDEFRQFGANAISARATTIDWATGEVLVARGNFPPETAHLLRATFDYYAGYGAFELSAITHEPGSPWHQVWHRPDGRVRMNMEISNGSIYEHFVASSRAASIQ